MLQVLSSAEPAKGICPSRRTDAYFALKAQFHDNFDPGGMASTNRSIICGFLYKWSYRA